MTGEGSCDHAGPTCPSTSLTICARLVKGGSAGPVSFFRADPFHRLPVRYMIEIEARRGAFRHRTDR
jgi:hypothetical protein